ncbi:hypothetical protein lerEdw1_011155 [Lerista edwardsae]|nr:hypothetical protein lerEdw1_011155 [Lerista edwardsae]
MPETQMEAAFFYIRQEFCKYGEKVDGRCLLTKAQVNKLLHEQMPSLFKVLKNPIPMEATTQENVNKMWKEMDYPGMVSLDEFLSLAGKLLM